MKNTSKAAASCLVLMSVFTFGGSAPASAATCTCSDENVGGGHTLSMTSPRINRGACVNGSVQAYLESLPGVTPLLPGAVCTISR